MRHVGCILLYPLILVALAFTGLRYAIAMCTSPDRAWAIAKQVDESANMGANGQPNETISARAGHAMIEHRAWGCVLCRVLDWIQPGHCIHALTEYRNK